MKTAYIELVKFALTKGMTVSVFDGEEWQVRRSSKIKEIKEAVESVEEAELRIRDANGNLTGWALVAAFGLEPEETIIDNTMTPLMAEFDAHYA